ncbi:MAG: class II glutamine amidotransferase [Alcanivoracaceae bacterium]|nr:class II glutamine amidotransferase [Alcanivoracaceae bacterium]
MCDLFALSFTTATEVSFSLNEFTKHGGLTIHLRHGWSIACYQ